MMTVTRGILQYSAPQDWIRFIYSTYSVLFFNKVVNYAAPAEVNTALGMKPTRLSKEELSDLITSINPNVVDVILDKKSYGFKIELVTKNSVAARSGLQESDIIFSINGVPVSIGETLTNFSLRLGEAAAGTKSQDTKIKKH